MARRGRLGQRAGPRQAEPGRWLARRAGPRDHAVQRVGEAVPGPTCPAAGNVPRTSATVWAEAAASARI